MNILNWIYFIAASIGYVFLLIGSIVNINDDEEDNVVLFNFFNYISIGLVFYTALSLFSNTVALIILWSILGLAIALSLYTIYKFIWGANSVSLFHKIISIIVLSVLIATILISFKLNISSSIVDTSLGDNYKYTIPIIEIILIIWIPLFILLLIYWRIKNNERENHTNESLLFRDNAIEDIIYKLYSLYQENDINSNDMPIRYFLEKSDMYMRNSDISAEIRRMIFRNIEYLFTKRIKMYSMSEFREMLLHDNPDYNSYKRNNYSFENTYLLENITENIQRIIRTEFSRNNKYRDIDYNSIKYINESIKELKILLSKQTLLNVSNKQNPVSVDELSTSQQQQFIKELFHCLMTPISQVDASLSIIKTKISQEDEILERSIKAIKAGIELTKSVLYAYRQIAFYTFNNSNDDTLTIKDGILSAELLYQRHSKKSISFNYENIPDAIPGFSSYFVLSALLPLLENAIYATEAGLSIKIEYIYTEQDYIFKIINPLKSPINLDNLYKSGFSSKNEKGKPHKGTGLSIVRNLIAKNENSKLDFELSENNILTTILKIHRNGI